MIRQVKLKPTSVSHIEALEKALSVMGAVMGYLTLTGARFHSAASVSPALTLLDGMEERFLVVSFFRQLVLVLTSALFQPDNLIDSPNVASLSGLLIRTIPSLLEIRRHQDGPVNPLANPKFRGQCRHACSRSGSVTVLTRSRSTMFAQGSAVG
jgi:hypothetical protein